MSAKAIIEAYVDDVVLRLPARQRKDIGFELRDLLNEELANKAAAAGRASDEAMARAMLKEFGAPSDVADRYRPGGYTLIPIREARLFAWIACVGVFVQWSLSFPLQVIAPTYGDFLSRLGAWSVGSGLHAFAWPGVMVMCAIVWAWRLHRTSKSDTVTIAMPGELHPLPTLDPQQVNRWAWGAALVGFAIGAPFYAIAPQLIGYLPDPAPTALAPDESFVRERGPWLLAVWAAQFALWLVVLFEGRWRSQTRLTDIALHLAGAAVVTWFIVGGPIFQAPQTDGFAKLVLGGVAVMIVGVTAVKFWREQARVGQARPPAA